MGRCRESEMAREDEGEKQGLRYFFHVPRAGEFVLWTFASQRSG